MTLVWHGLFWLTAIVSGAAPIDRLTWSLEAAPAFAIYAGLLAVGHRVRLSPLSAWWSLALIVIIFTGGHYGFAAVPGFDGLRPLPGGPGMRNEFDKFAHFFQGLVPALVFRELLIRGRVITVPRLIPILTVALTLALSALYELCEWASHLALGSRADAFIASQSDPWDAQGDMAMALLGALVALAGLSRLHDASLAGLGDDDGVRSAKNSFDKAPFRG